MGKRQGLVSGTSFGGMQFVMFCSYAVALFYGAHRVAVGAYSGGDVVNVIIAALLGSFSLGLVSRAGGCSMPSAVTDPQFKPYCWNSPAGVYSS
jgi:hypothetical protein